MGNFVNNNSQSLVYQSCFGSPSGWFSTSASSFPWIVPNTSPLIRSWNNTPSKWSYSCWKTLASKPSKVILNFVPRSVCASI
jgi:hypothetical protein